MGIVLVITGMHRSGTSMVADYLQQCGMDIGETLQAADVGNPRGYFEDVDFLRFHQDLLAHFSLSTFPTNDRELDKRIPGAFRLRAQQTLRRKEQSPFWGWKDCRTTLFLRFWQEMIPNINVLFLFRHPLSVVDSLLRRGTDPIITRRPVIAFRSWWLHNQRILQFCRQNQATCFLVDINDLVNDPAVAFSRLFSKLGIDLPASDFDTVYEPSAFKHEKAPRDIYVKLRYPFQTRRCLRLYRDMKQSADWPTPGEDPTLGTNRNSVARGVQEVRGSDR